jgi:hypothetical protein
MAVRPALEVVARSAATRLAEIAFVSEMECVVFRFRDERIFGLSLKRLAGLLEGLDSSPVTFVSVRYDGGAALIEQFSGNRLELPWNVILYHVDPAYPTTRPERGSPEEADRQRVDRGIGDRVRRGRRRRKWTLTDMSAATGFTVPYLSRVERGEQTASLETLEKIAEVLGLPVALLMAQRAWPATTR